ncbi:MAG: hypothetical protein ABFD76_17085 [Smithella sp.]
MKEEKKDYCKNSLCTASTPADCINFSPVHDLQDVCWFCGLGWTCDFPKKEHIGIE